MLDVGFRSVWLQFPMMDVLPTIVGICYAWIFNERGNMGQLVRPRKVIIYADNAGKEPFTRWLNSLKDGQTRRRILQRIARLQSGNFGDFKSLKNGVLELRLSFGSGYRIYFGEEGDRLVILLCGGDKTTQKHDIETAKRYWKEYQSHE